MEDESKKTLMAVQSALKILLSGKQCGTIECCSPVPELQKVVEQLNQLIQHLNEINRLAFDLSKGKLDGPTPSRHNYMAGVLKQLHSQLSILAWSGRQLQSGQVVSKLEHTGELFEIFNGLIDQVALVSVRGTNNSASNVPAPVNSWRYHQILQALNLLHILVLEVDSSGRVVYANRLAKEILGSIEYIPSEQIESNVLLELIAKFSKADNAFPVFREVYEDSSGIWYRIMSDRFSLPNGQVFYLHMIEDISDWKKSEYQLVLSATMDEMTGTYNRKVGLEELEKILFHVDTSKKHCVAFIDIDGLKTINDTYGHNEGDNTIKSIAKVLLSSIRDSDIVCRYGGDEFLIIFKNCTEEVAGKIIARMYKELKKLDSKNPKPYTLSFSYGIASFCSNPASNVVDILALADQKMYAYKTRKKQELQ
ncbi:GGDEF domain-containing protein [Geosporobacter ferrireducens]|uniref:Diguanylate cyclase n=1 Tax=Geosporobacter ferrireducens TaxID=1424294 RepID=A0A1D8GLN2_9FIRM|nr:diguanylate cyclase [Geosporobacter ferrireducens]AOT71825.1 diguanylate cyclase [Geosporobacter ferrireducens]MTI55611.1 sensor domain-containing diguanylate cyclase [Geosporobacter ferrireducens]